MTQTEEREIRTNRGGMIVVIVLAVIFFVLIALILGGVKRGADPAARGSAPVTVFVVPQKLRIRAEPSAKADVIDQDDHDVLESAQKAIGANGFEYTAHSPAGLAANEPGNQNWLSGGILFAPPIR